MATQRHRASRTAAHGGTHANGNLVAAFFVCAIFMGVLLVASHPLSTLQHGAEAMGNATAAAYQQARQVASEAMEQPAGMAKVMIAG